MRQLLQKVVVGAAAVAFSFALSAAGGPEREGDPPEYELKLVYLFDGPETEFVFVIGNSGFRTVASLEAFLASRPPGTVLRWNPGCERIGGEPLLSSEIDMDEFEAFCLEHQIDFVLVPSG